MNRKVTSVVWESTRKIAKLVRVTAATVEISATTRSPEFAKSLVMKVLSKENRSGMLHTSQGTIRYNSLHSLPGMMQEIFVENVYLPVSLPESPRIIDCGANIGLATIRFKAAYPDATILAFEADPFVYETLQENLQRTKQVGVTPINAAVASKPGTVQFSSDRDMGGRVDTQGSESVPAVRLSDYIVERVDLLKLDVEGSEFDVLEDLAEHDKLRMIDKLVIEVHTTCREASRVERLFGILNEAGYDVAVRWASPLGSDGSGQFPFFGGPLSPYLMHVYGWRAKDQRTQC